MVGIRPERTKENFTRNQAAEASAATDYLNITKKTLVTGLYPWRSSSASYARLKKLYPQSATAQGYQMKMALNYSALKAISSFTHT